MFKSKIIEKYKYYYNIKLIYNNIKYLIADIN